MNQILSTQDNKKRKKSKNTSILDMKQIIKTFSFVLIAFVLVILGVKIYGMLKSDKKNALNIPTIDISRMEMEKKAIIKAEYDEGIEKIIYWWDTSSDKQEINVNGGTKKEQAIDIPEGNNNILHTKVIGKDGSIKELEKEFMINWYYNNEQETCKINIVVGSHKGIESLTYYWEGEEPTTISAPDGQQEINTTIDIKRGTNKLFIKAKNKNSETEEISENIIGVKEPIINMIIENNTLKIDVRHDKGFKKIIFKVNDQEMIYDENQPSYKADNSLVKIDIIIPPGTSKIDVEVKAYTQEQPEEEYVKKQYANLME